MGQRAVSVMTADEFFTWQLAQDGLYELVDGFPVKMMSGAENRHDDITTNLIVESGLRLRGKPCKPTTQDTGIRISDTQIRRPDMAIKCGPSREKTYYALDPRAVFEVLSPSTRGFDLTKKLEEYKSVSTLRHIVLIDPESPEIVAHQRRQDGIWESRTIKGLDAEIPFDDLGFDLSLAEIYRGVSFHPKPILIVTD